MFLNPAVFLVLHPRSVQGKLYYRTPDIYMLATGRTPLPQRLHDFYHAFTSVKWMEEAEEDSMHGVESSTSTMHASAASGWGNWVTQTVPDDTDSNEIYCCTCILSKSTIEELQLDFG
jgi:hypothetical protein